MWWLVSVGEEIGCPSVVLWVSGLGIGNRSIRCVGWCVVRHVVSVWRHGRMWVDIESGGMVLLLPDGDGWSYRVGVVAVSWYVVSLWLRLADRLVSSVAREHMWCRQRVVPELFRCS